MRVTWDGERKPVADDWAGYRWNSLVGMPALTGYSRTRHASYGVDATIAFLDDALDWVATNTPADHRDPLPRGHRHLPPQHARTAGHRAAQRRARPIVTLSDRIDRALEQTGSVRAVAVLRIAIGPIVLLHLRPFLADAVGR